MQYQLTTDSLIQFATAIAAFITIGLLWKFRRSVEVKHLIFVEFFVAIWAFTYGMEFSTNDLATKIFWSKMSYLGIAVLPVFHFLFMTAFSQNMKVVQSPYINLLFIIPLITVILVFTNEKHLLIWTNVYADPVKNLAHYEHGAWFWIFYAFTEILLFSGLFNLVRSAHKFTSYYRSQTIVLLIASFFPIVSNLMYVTKINPFPGFDWTPVSFVLTGLIISLGVIHYKMFDLVPMAKSKLLDIMNDGVIVVNADGFIEDCNPAIYKIFNRQHKALLQVQFNKVFKDYPELVDGLENNIASIKLKIKQNNTDKYFHVNFSPIYRNKKYTGSLLLFHDITSVHQAEQELKSTNKQLMLEIEKREKLIEDLDSFAHTVAHDLRNSLGSIFSASQIMEDIIKQNDNKLLFELTNLINNSAGKSIQITKELLLLATTDKQNIEIHKLNMNEIISKALKQLADLTIKYNAEVILPAEWHIANGYAPWVEEIWTNYISNAIKYGGTPPKVTLGSERISSSEIMFWVKDNGEGLKSDDQKKLFNNFVRLEPGRAEGYGLGLTIVKKIVEKLNGKVGIKSEGDGNGSVFYFTMPAAKKTKMVFNNNSFEEINLN